MPVEHDGNTNSSDEEVKAVEAIVETLLKKGSRWTNQKGETKQVTPDDILVVAPFNAQVNRLQDALDSKGIRVGTVDRFQGQEGAIVIYSMATSRPEDAPRGMEFLYDLNRLNVATSRARCACILVASPAPARARLQDAEADAAGECDVQMRGAGGTSREAPFREPNRRTEELACAKCPVASLISLTCVHDLAQTGDEMSKRSTTTKDIGLIHQLHDSGQLRLAPEFQRNAVWPRAAKAYLVHTILSERPMPLFFFQRARSAQTGKPTYAVVDGQQRLRAIFEFIDGRYALTESKDRRWKGKRFSELNDALQENFLNYDLTIEELTGYDDDEIRDIFVRMNKYVVKLSPQELRHARDQGRFYDFVEALARLSFWREQRVFTPHQLSRMKAAEFAAELTILLIEGPQDKKSSVDLYYGEYQRRFASATEVQGRLTRYLAWLLLAVPRLKHTRFRKPTDLYSLVGALDKVSRNGETAIYDER